MNKRAEHDVELAPLWHIGDTQSIFAGPLHYNSRHSHSVPVLIAGLHGKFGIRVANSAWISVHAAVVQAGTPYELDVGGAAISVIYIEPSVAGLELLHPLLGNTVEIAGATIGTCSVRARLREFYEDRDSTRWAHGAIDDLFHSAKGAARSVLDQRISRVVSALRNAPVTQPAEREAAAVGLSSSRFQHLFAEQVGVPFRRYRSWCRLREAVRAVVNGHSLTTAAHDAGFADQSHFSRAFRQTFGAPPSGSLSQVRS